MRLLFDPAFFNYVIMGLYAANIAWWGWQGSYANAAYWGGALWITGAVTWGLNK
jgi:hypothetical protein